MIKSILFVCHGNICRSPMAEFILKDMLQKFGRTDIIVASASTSTEEIRAGVGNPIYPPARTQLNLKNIPFDENKRAVQVVPSDYEKYDLIVVMDKNNLRNIKYIIPNDYEHKIKTLLSFIGENRDVADPWYTGDFETCFNDIYAGCQALMKIII